MTNNALAVESRPGNFIALARLLEKMNIKAMHALTLSEADGILAGQEPIAVAIIDLMGFGDDIWDFCRALRRKGVPMLIISPSNNPKAFQAGFEHGAKGVLKKPVMMRELADCIRALITQG